MFRFMCKTSYESHLIVHNYMHSTQGQKSKINLAIYSAKLTRNLVDKKLAIHNFTATISKSVSLTFTLAPPEQSIINKKNYILAQKGNKKKFGPSYKNAL